MTSFTTSNDIFCLQKLGAEVAVGEFVLGRHKTLSEKLLDLTGGPPGSREREIFKKQYGISDEENISRTSVNGDGSDLNINSSNSFLHDNVD